MHNDLFTIGPLTVHGYGLMIAIGILVGMALADKQAKKHGLRLNDVDNIVYVALAAGWACAKLTYILVEFKAFLADPVSFISSSGWVVYGGLIGGIIGAYLYCRAKKLNFMDHFNLIIPQVALAQAFGRVGCFLAGCCYGIETDLPIGVVFPPESLAIPGVKLFPTQLFSAAGDLLLYLVLLRIFENEKTRNSTAACYLIFYSAGRFMIEFLRGDIARGSIGILSTSQFIALFTFAAGILLFVTTRKQKESIT